MSQSGSAAAPGDRQQRPTLEWKAEYDTILSDIATTNLVSTPWAELRDIFMSKISQNLESLPLFPPKPIDGHGDAEMTLVDDEEMRKAQLQGEEQLLQRRIWDSFSAFGQEAPFTVQRLAELAVNPKRHYTTSTKYLRALHRTLQVSSGHSSFVLDTYALSPGPAESSLLGHVSTASSNATSPLLQSSRASSMSPLLSPIPWMVGSSTFADSDSEDGHTDPTSSPHNAPVNGHDASLAEGGSPSLPPISPTGGRVDELDPLPPSLSAPQPTGMTDTPLAISDPQGSPPRTSHSPDLAGSPTSPSRVRRPSF